MSRSDPGPALQGSYLGGEPGASSKHPAVAFGFGVPRSDQTTVTSCGLFGLTEMLPAEVQRIWWPQTVCRAITENGMSLRPSSSWAAFLGSPKVRPPFVDLTTMICESNSNGTSQAASSWLFRKWT